MQCGSLWGVCPDTLDDIWHIFAQSDAHGDHSCCFGGAGGDVKMMVLFWQDLFFRVEGGPQRFFEQPYFTVFQRSFLTDFFTCLYGFAPEAGASGARGRDSSMPCGIPL